MDLPLQFVCEFDSTRLHTTQHDSTVYYTTRLHSTRHNTTRLDSTPHDITRLTLHDTTRFISFNMFSALKSASLKRVFLYQRALSQF
jgi:hypothetical protein